MRIRKNIKKLSLDLGDVIVRSDLCDFTFKNTPSLLKEIAKILTKSSENTDYFLTVSQGIFETNIVTSKNLQPFVRQIFEQETLTNSMLELGFHHNKITKRKFRTIRSLLFYFKTTSLGRYSFTRNYFYDK